MQCFLYKFKEQVGGDRLGGFAVGRTVDGDGLVFLEWRASKKHLYAV